MERVLARLAEADERWSAPDELDEIKALEAEVLRRLESSSLQAAAGSREPALEDANEAARLMGALKVASQRNQQARANDPVGGRPLGQPLTTGVNLFDLALAVKCNLAERLKDNGQLGEALEMYTQICKMAAIDQVAGDGANSAGSNRLLSDSHATNQQQHQSRLLLYRFGLEMGNVLYEMGEFQRALKFYRLTLDRLSTLAGQRSLQIKLMNNITIALMALNGAIPGAIRRQGAAGSPAESNAGRSLLAGRTNDHMTSLNLLLADNTLEPPPAGTKTSQAGARPDADHQAEASHLRQVINGRHHAFALNLMVCHHQNSNAAAIYSTLKALLDTNSCGPQFRRLPVGGFGAGHEERGRLLAEMRHDERALAHAAPPGQMMSSSNSSADSRRRPTFDQELEMVGGRTPEQIVRPHDQTNERETKSTPSTDRMAASANAKTNAKTETCSPADELETLIQSREHQIHRALLVGCKLAIDLEARLSAPPSRPSANDNLGRAGQTSALAKCCKLAASSELHRCLRDELLSNSVAGQCLAAARGGLARALFVLEQIALNQQVAVGAQVRPKLERSSQAGAKLPRHRSPLVEANLSLLRSLRSSGATLASIEIDTVGHLLDGARDDFLANAANHEMSRGEFERALELLAMLKSTRRWPITFNRLLASAALQLHPDDLGDLVAVASGESLRDGPCGSFSHTKMALLGLKLAALFAGAGLLQRSQAALVDLLPSDGLQPSLSPELCLLATTPGTNAAPDWGPRQPVLASLEQASRWHPYHLALAQRLIALLISGFDYAQATRRLADCVKNRPDQVKWYQMLAECHQRDANYNEAIRIYRHALENFPASSESCARALAKLEDELGLGSARRRVS